MQWRPPKSAGRGWWRISHSQGLQKLLLLDFLDLASVSRSGTAQRKWSQIPHWCSLLLENSRLNCEEKWYDVLPPQETLVDAVGSWIKLLFWVRFWQSGPFCTVRVSWDEFPWITAQGNCDERKAASQWSMGGNEQNETNQFLALTSPWALNYHSTLYNIIRLNGTVMD